MATSFNKVILAGNLTRDPELRTFANGGSVAKLSLAINRRYKVKETNEMREEVTYVDVDSFGSAAETIAKYCTKGSGLLIEGRLKLDQWDDKNTGEKRSRLGVVLEGFNFIGGRAPGEGGGNAPAAGGNYEASSPPPRRPAPAAAPRAQQAPAADGVEEDVPF